jgi:hypothetical protein
MSKTDAKRLAQLQTEKSLSAHLNADHGSALQTHLSNQKKADDEPISVLHLFFRMN